MKKRKNRILASAAVCLAALCAAGAVSAAAADPGSQGDPLVTLSYLTETVTPQMLAKVDEAVAAREKALTDQLSASIQKYESEMKAAIGQGGGAGSAYAAVTLKAGQTVTMQSGCELLSRTGTLTATVPSGSTLVDSTGGSAVKSGASLTANHLYIASGSGCTVKVTVGGTALLKGGYSVK